LALKSDAAAEKSKDQLSRDFPGRSIFDFCNNIRPEAVAPAKFVYDPKPRCPAMRRIGVLISFRKSDHEAGSLVAEFREEDCRDARLVDLPER
jgi:hypothetical protein